MIYTNEEMRKAIGEVAGRLSGSGATQAEDRLGRMLQQLLGELADLKAATGKQLRKCDWCDEVRASSEMVESHGDWVCPELCYDEWVEAQTSVRDLPAQLKAKVERIAELEETQEGMRLSFNRLQEQCCDEVAAERKKREATKAKLKTAVGGSAWFKTIRDQVHEEYKAKLAEAERERDEAQSAARLSENTGIAWMKKLEASQQREKALRDALGKWIAANDAVEELDLLKSTGPSYVLLQLVLTKAEARAALKGDTE